MSCRAQKIIRDKSGRMLYGQHLAKVPDLGQPHQILRVKVSKERCVGLWYRLREKSQAILRLKASGFLLFVQHIYHETLGRAIRVNSVSGLIAWSTDMPSTSLG